MKTNQSLNSVTGLQIQKENRPLETVYTPRWTEEIFTAIHNAICNMQYTNPTTCKLVDMKEEEIQAIQGTSINKNYRRPV